MLSTRKLYEAVESAFDLKAVRTHLACTTVTFDTVMLLGTRPIPLCLQTPKFSPFPTCPHRFLPIFTFLCFKFRSERRAGAAVSTQESHSYLAASISGIAPAEQSPRKPTEKTIWLLLCANTFKTTGNLCFLQAAPVHTAGFSEAISHLQH